MEYHEEMLLGLRRNMQIRTRCSVRLRRGRHHLHRLFLFLFLLILIFRFLKVLDRHRQVSQTRARGQHPDDTSKAKSRTVVGPPVVLLPGQSAGKKDPPSTGDFPGFDEPASSSSAPAPVPGLPVTEGDFPIQQTPLPEPTAEPPVPEDGEDTDSDATVDYRGDSLLALVAGDDDVLIRLPDSFEVPSFVPLDGDGFASWWTKQDKIKAGTVTLEMQRKYAKEIRAAKLEEFKSYLDNDAIRLTDRRRLNRDVNFLTARWVLTVKVDKNGYFSKFKARWVCRGFQDKFAWDQQTDSPIRLLGMVSVWLRSVWPTTFGTFFIWISRLVSFRGNTTICHLEWL